MILKDKGIVRKEALGIRNAMKLEEVMKKSLAITKQILALDKFNTSHVVMCYMNFKNEVMTEKLIATSIKEGKRVLIPKVEAFSKGLRVMSAVEIHNPLEDLEIGTYGILEPKEHCKAISPEEIDLVVVPGAAFDHHKNRIGYGGGYYDRFLQRIREDCLKIGIAFDNQIYNELPVEEHDVTLDMILTESFKIV